MLSTPETVVGALDMASGHDRRLLRTAINRHHWPITEEKLARYAQALDVALTMSLQEKDRRDIISCVKALTTIVGQNLDDLHHRERLEAGQGSLTDGTIQVQIVNVQRPLGALPNGEHANGE